jgi:hypothetical protein
MMSYYSMLLISPVIPYYTFHANSESLCFVSTVSELDFANEFKASPLYPIDLDL